MKRILPKKGQYRVRAHVNPFSRSGISYPPHHSYVDWKSHFPSFYGGTYQQNLMAYCNTRKYPAGYDQPINYSIEGKGIDIIDIGCGYGGLLFALAPIFPEKLILGLEIRQTIANYVCQKIQGYRTLHEHQYNNIGVVHTNTMKYLCAYLPKGSLQKIFVCFPDPHFKNKNFKRRIISTGFLSEYAYLLKPKGKIYCVTDVQELHLWHLKHLRGHSMFEEVNGQDDECVGLMLEETEEGRKVEREGRDKYWAVFQKVELD